MNAVDAGLPMLRPVRAATSFATDAYGRVLGSMRWHGSSDGVMVVDVSNQRVPTLYLRTGEIIPLLAIAFLAVVGLRVVGVPRVARVALRPS